MNKFGLIAITSLFCLGSEYALAMQEDSDPYFQITVGQLRMKERPDSEDQSLPAQYVVVIEGEDGPEEYPLMVTTVQDRCAPTEERVPSLEELKDKNSPQYKSLFEEEEQRLGTYPIAVTDDLVERSLQSQGIYGFKADLGFLSQIFALKKKLGRWPIFNEIREESLILAKDPILQERFGHLSHFQRMSEWKSPLDRPDFKEEGEYNIALDEIVKMKKWIYVLEILNNTKKYIIECRESYGSVNSTRRLIDTYLEREADQNLEIVLSGLQLE
ncbi:MAG: hypothetical protein JSR85_03065 [Proteobacteria bacterium]|nr:hypothetical protein [Pseudomonadota bacterium]